MRTGGHRADGPGGSAAIAGIDEATWAPIRYPNAVWDEDEARWISDAEVAEVAFTAFTSRRKADHLTARLIDLKYIAYLRDGEPLLGRPTGPAQRQGRGSDGACSD